MELSYQMPSYVEGKNRLSITLVISGLRGAQGNAKFNVLAVG